MATETAEASTGPARKGKQAVAKRAPKAIPKRKNRKRQPAKKLTLDQEIAKALSHPWRTQILTYLGDRAMSPAELEPFFGKGSLSNVAYHCRVLEKYNCIEAAGQEQVRGAMKTKYRAVTRMLLDGENWDRLSKETRSGISSNAVGEVIDRATAAIEADTFDKRTDRAVITLRFDADESAWQQANEIVRDAWERLSAVEADAANRQGDKFRMTVSMRTYESPEDNLAAA